MKKKGPSRIRTGDGGFAIRCQDSPTSDTINELGQTPNAEVPVVVPRSSEDAPHAQFPPDLTLVVAAWDRLPEAIKAGILALIQAAGGSND